MSERISFEDFRRSAQTLVDDLHKIKPDLQELAANNAKAIFNLRVFNGDSKDIDGKSLSSPATDKYLAYSKAYGKKRNKAGKGTDKVDLQYTDELKHSIQVGRFGGSPALGILPNRSDGENNQNVAGYLEETYGVKIFEMSDDEVRSIAESIADEIERRLKP